MPTMRFQKYLDNADRILDVPLEKRSQKWADAIVDHFVINYHRVISKGRMEAAQLRRAP